MGALLDQRRLQSTARLSELRGQLTEAAILAADSACIYTTGSFARGEASPHSDLDLFIVCRSITVKGEIKRKLRRLDETCIRADLIRQTRALRIPEFSGDGAYLTSYTVAELVKNLGTREDDAVNTFTARLLLLLESRPLIGETVYKEAIQQTIDAYWKDFPDHKANFMPAFLANDILRLWRTFCVNYEAGTQREPEMQKAKRKLKNYKLKHSRLLTCYSALLYLLAIWNRKGTVAPSDASEMVSLTPTQRLETLTNMPALKPARTTLTTLLRYYEQFLKETDASEKELMAQLLDPRKARQKFKDPHRFGAKMFDALELIGRRSDFHRMLVV